MKIMSYNILEGGHLSKGDRTDLLIDIIRESSPDILGLNECRGFADDDEARLRLFERELGMSGVLNESASGNHIAILFRPDLPVVERSGKSISMHNGYTRITLQTEIGSLAVVATHLHPFASVFRVGEMQIVAARAAAADAAIVMGDMNSVAPGDAAVLELAGAPHTMTERLRGPAGGIDTEAVSVLLNRDYTDLGAKGATPTYPTPLSSEKADPLVRLDYMFATARVAERCREFSVAGGESGPRASDHLPIVAEIDLPMAAR
jgi:endonuclease/exonuclease/phosphatase family metal-dependent hydrolase